MSKINRRDFSRNIARYGLAGAVGLFVGIKKVTETDAITCYHGSWIASVCTSCYGLICTGGGRQAESCWSQNNCSAYGRPSNCCNS